MAVKKFTIEKKLVVQVRYYETMYFIKDSEGDRVFTGSDEKTAKRVLSILNGYGAIKKKRGRKR